MNVNRRKLQDLVFANGVKLLILPKALVYSERDTCSNT